MSKELELYVDRLTRHPQRGVSLDRIIPIAVIFKEHDGREQWVLRAQNVRSLSEIEIALLDIRAIINTTEL